MVNLKALSACCAISIAAITQSITVLADSCVNLSRAKYSAKSANFTSFYEEPSATTVRIFVGFRKNLNTFNVASSIPGRIIHRYEMVNAVAAEIPASAIGKLAKGPNIRILELDGLVHSLSIPSENRPVDEPAQQIIPHGITRSGAPELWSKTKGQGVVVAVIDTGIDDTHPDLEGRVIGGRNFSSSKDPEAWKDGHGHGTHVSGTVAANDNQIGVVGIAPEASLLGIKVLDDYGSGTFADVTAGVEYAVTAGAHVANMSLGGTRDVQILHEALIKAHEKGVIFAAAAGNSGEDYGNPLNYPGAYPEVIGVAAVDDKDLRAYFSTYNKFVAIAAHGVDVLSSVLEGAYEKYSGTSMATPHIAGSAALLKSLYPDEDITSAKRRLVCNADDQWPNGRDKWTGYGVVHLAKASQNSAPAECTYLQGQVSDPIVPSPVAYPEPNAETPAVYVKSTALTLVNDGNARNKQLLVTFKVFDQVQQPVVGATVKTRILERFTGPLGTTTGTTDQNGEAQFVLTGFNCGQYIAEVISVDVPNFSNEMGQPAAEIDLGGRSQ